MCPTLTVFMFLASFFPEIVFYFDYLISKFFQQVIIQLMDGAAERAINFPHRADGLDEPTTDSAFLFVGETFSRICRRGSTGTRRFVKNYLMENDPDV